MEYQAQTSYHNNKKNGLTLIELLIVITVIALLVGVLLPNLNDVRRRSRDQRRKADIKSLVEALELYKLDKNPPAYPTSIPAPGSSWTEGDKTYMNKVPQDPFYTIDSTKYFYRYTRNATDTLKYYLGACLEDATDIEGTDTLPSGIDWTDCPTNFWYIRSEP